MASWDFPNYHNMYKEPAQLPPRAWYDLNDRIERDCSATPLIPEGRCFRWLSRPRILGDAGGIYELSFGLDRAGLYSLSVGYRGTADPYDSEGNAVLGTGIKGSPFEMTVIAGRVDNRLSQAVELPTEAFEDGCPVDEDACGKLDEGIIGVRGLFAVQPRDRFGNDVVDQRSFVLEVSFRGVQYVQASTARPAAAESTTTAWAKISSVENSGLKKIEYFLTSRSRVDPNYSAFITINNRPISGPSVMVDEEARPDQSLTESSLQPYRITVLPAPTKGGTSFAVEARASENGLGVQAPVIAGFEATFSIRARDRFGNSQGFPDGTEYATTEDTNFKSTDPFMVVVEDANGNCGVDVVADVRDEGAFVFPGAADAWGVTNAQGNRACVGKTQWDALGESADPKPPKVEVYREERTTHVDGLYSVKYTMQKAGETKITAYLCDINLLVSSGRCGLSPAPNKPATSTQANVFGEALQVEPQAGVNQWPHVLTVQAGPTRPGMSTALGAGVDTFQAGTVGEQGGGVDFFVTARDQFGNVKTNPERALLEVRNMPRMVVRYQTDCAGTVVDHPTKGCEGIYQRQISLVGRSSVKINEVPLRLSGSTVYSASEARVTFTTSTVYLGNSPDTLGVFRTRFTTTLAGRFDIRIDLPRGVRGGTIEDQRYPIKGANSKVGGARLMPYEEPYPLVVTPGEFSGAFSEVFFFMDSNKTLVSSHHGLSHQFTTSDTSVTAAKMTSAGVIGRADVDQNTFYIQARDRYANAKTDLASGEGFSSITITAFDPSSKSTLVLKSTCGGSDATLTSEASPNRGLWSVRYCSRRALRYTIAVASSSGQELTRVAYDNTSGSLQATSERFVLTVRAGAPSAAHFTASGDGLRGATFKGVTENLSTGVSVSVGEIFVVARDEYGNRIDGTLAEAQQIAAQLQLKLWICDYTAAPECLFSDSDCTFQNREATEKLTSSPTKAEDGTYFETTIWEPVRGQAGTFKIVWTPRPWPGDCTENKYYTYLDIEYQTTRIGGTESGQGFPQLAVAHNGAGGTLDVAKSFVSSWNGAELGAYEGSVVGEAQTIVVTLVSEDGFVLRNRSSVGEITVVLTKTGSTRLGTTGVDDVVLTLEATAAELQGSGQIRYNSDGAIVITIPAKESIDDSAAGISEEGFYKIDIKLVPTVESGATAPAAESINGMPFVDLFFRPAPTSPRFTRVRHHPEVSSSAPLVDPGNISGANVPELYQTISGSTALLVTAGEPIKFRLEARDDFNNRQLGSKTSSSSALVTNPDNFAVVVAAAPPSAPLSVTSTTDNGDGTYDLEVSQTAQGTYTLRFYLTSDPRSQGPETLLQGAGETAAGSLVRGLLGRPSPGPSASDFSLPVRIVPGPAHVPNFTASWNLVRGRLRPSCSISCVFIWCSRLIDAWHPSERSCPLRASLPTHILTRFSSA